MSLLYTRVDKKYYKYVGSPDNKDTNAIIFIYLLTFKSPN